MSNYTDLQNIRTYSEENNANVNDTINENIYSNTEQEITPDMINEAVKAVEDDRFNNTENVVDFLEKSTTKNVKIRLYDGLGVEWRDTNYANIINEELNSLLLIQVPKYTRIYVYGLTEDMWKQSCVLNEFVDGDDITGNHRYADIANWYRGDTSADFTASKTYRVYSDSFKPDTVYSWSEDGEINYISTKDTTVVLTVRDEMNVSEFYYSPNISIEGTRIMVDEEEVETLTFENNNYFDNENNSFIRDMSDVLQNEYYFPAISEVIRKLKTEVYYTERNGLGYNSSTGKWSTSTSLMRIIKLEPYDTFTIKGFNLPNIGVTINLPQNGQTANFVEIYPTIDELSEDWNIESITYDGGLIDTRNEELKITNTTSYGVYIWFRTNYPPTSPYYVRINDINIFYDVSNHIGTWEVNQLNLYKGWEVLANNGTAKINMLYIELGKMHKLLYDIIQNIQ